MFGKNNGGSGLGDLARQGVNFGLGAAVGHATVETIKKHDEVKEQMRRDEEAHKERMKQIKASRGPHPSGAKFNNYSGEIGRFLNLPDDYYKGFGIEDSQLPGK